MPSRTRAGATFGTQHDLPGEYLPHRDSNGVSSGIVHRQNISDRKGLELRGCLAHPVSFKHHVLTVQPSPGCPGGDSPTAPACGAPRRTRPRDRLRQIHRLAALDKGANLLKGPNPLRLYRHDHPPMIPNTDLQAHVSLDLRPPFRLMSHWTRLGLHIAVPRAQNGHTSDSTCSQQEPQSSGTM